jgi:DNA modification methylase
MKTQHKIYFKSSSWMEDVEDNSVDLVVTSPPYPMIEMWDEIFSSQEPKIRTALENKNGNQAFELMHTILDSVWKEVYRVVKEGGFVCINIGDATRTLNGDFSLYPNHMRILHCFLNLGFTALPCILWRKQTNAPNKFMGSGTLPAGAYVTLEHEYILIFRKGSKREFKTKQEKKQRYESSMFWEERNNWYSDVWFDIKGTSQTLNGKKSRIRSAAYPFELAYRLVNMYSIKSDYVLDPFLGTGTTIGACIASGRNSIGYEIDKAFKDIINESLNDISFLSNHCMLNRINNHLSFVKKRLFEQKPFKHKNTYYGFPVITSQEKELLFSEVVEVKTDSYNASYITIYSEKPHSSLISKDQYSTESDIFLNCKQSEKDLIYGIKDISKKQNQLTFFH